MILSLLLCIVGFLLLYFGADWLVKGSSSLARAFGITPLLIGLTVVAFGTSTPELVVSVISSIKGNSMIAVGNVIGSNICNIALVLGLAAIFQPITSHRLVITRDIPLMLGVSVYILLLSLNSQLGRLEGFSLLVGITAYTLFNYRIAKKESRQGLAPEKILQELGVEAVHYIESRTKQILFICFGIAGVVGGAEVVVDNAVKIMTVLGVSEKFIGLTIVAFGTSLPELATSVVAALRKEMDISIGNLVGSNVFNILSVLGAASLIKPIAIPGGFYGSGLWIDYLVMLATSLLPWLLMRKTNTISRSGGIILLSCYVVYLTHLILKTI